MISFKKFTGKNDDAAAQEAKKAEEKASIFGKTLNATSMVKSKRAKYLEGKNRKLAYARLGASAVALIAYSAFFFYGNVTAYLKAPGQIAEMQGEIKQYDEVILPDLEKTRDLHKAAYDEEYAEIIQSLDDVFPRDIEKLEMIQLFESFATEVAVQYPPFEFTSINLGKAEAKDGYMVIPVSTSIHSSLAGFDRFLSLVERSGQIFTGEGEDRKILDKKIRLMSVSNISITYQGVDENTGEDEGVDFAVKLNVYSRAPGNTKTK